MMADPPRFEHGFPAPEARVISRLHYGSNPLRGQASIKTDCSLAVDFLQKNLDHVADPPRFEHGLQGSASSCDIQATLWVQCVSHFQIRYNVDGRHRLNGRSVFHLDSASFLAFGPVLGFGFLWVSTPCIPVTPNLTLNSMSLSLSATRYSSSLSSIWAGSIGPPALCIESTLPSIEALGWKSWSSGWSIHTSESMIKRSLIEDFVISIDFTMATGIGGYSKPFSRRNHQHRRRRPMDVDAFSGFNVLGFDTETTGLNPRKDRIVQYAFVGVDANGERVVIDSPGRSLHANSPILDTGPRHHKQGCPGTYTLQRAHRGDFGALGGCSRSRAQSKEV